MNRDAKVWLTAIAMASMTCAARAQDTQFDVTGQFAGGGTLSGELTINTLTGTVDSGSLTVAGLPDRLAVLDGTYAGTLVFGTEPGYGYVYEDLFSGSFNTPFVFLTEPVS